MTPQRWQKIKKIVEEALECEPARRKEFLVAACAGDQALYKEVEALIAIDEQASEFLEIPAHKAFSFDTAANPPRPPDAQDGLKLGDLFLGKFELLRLIGKGGMGQVYQARNVDQGTMVAIKVMNRCLTQDNEAIERFKREARAAAKVEHPNTVRVFDYGVKEAACYLVMEYLEGESLRERLRKRGRMALPAVIDFAQQACQALAIIHRKGIIHRDLKPDNIFFHKQETQEIVKLLDFGVAKWISLTFSGDAITNPGAIFGTPHYMSPEQCLGKDLDGRSDIYSLGIILYEMLSGRKPFEADSTLSFMYAHVHTKPQPLADIMPELPAPVSTVIMRALEKNPETRFKSAEELLQSLTMDADSAAAYQLQPNISATSPPAMLAISSDAHTLLLSSVKSTNPRLSKLLAAGLAAISIAIVSGAWKIFHRQPATAKILSSSPIKLDKNRSIKLPEDKFALIAGGTVIIGLDANKCQAMPDCEGADNESPPHPVTLAQYYLGKYEVTNQEYQEFIVATGHLPPPGWQAQNYPKGADRMPVTNVSWHDANSYCQWRVQQEGISYRLPTEEEWEHAARGDRTNIFPWGDLWDSSFANASKKNVEPRSTLSIDVAPNNSTDKSPFGIYAMAGNVREWTSSNFKLYPDSKYQPAQSDFQSRVIRGGSFKIAATAARTSYRGWDLPDKSYDDLGFRLAVTAE